MKSLIVFLVLTLCLVAPLSHAGVKTKNEQIFAMKVILAELDDHYGMIKYKEEQFGITLKKLEQKYKKLIQQARTLEEEMGYEPAQSRPQLSEDEFRQLMIGMVAEFKDGHTNISRVNADSHHGASIGLRTAAIDGRLYVTGVIDDIYKDESTTKPLRLGDEIVSVNGKNVQELADKNLLYIQSGTYESRRRSAMQTILTVPYALLPKKQEGELVEVTFRRGEEIIKGRFHWVEFKDLLKLQVTYPDYHPSPRGAYTREADYWYGQRGTVRSYFRHGLLSAQSQPGQIIDIGKIINTELKEASSTPGRKSGDLLPFKAVERLQAYFVVHRGKNIGVVRIPSYSPGGLPEMMNEYLWLAEAIKRLAASTEALIIDHLGNSGGALFMGNKILSLFAGDEALETVTTDYRLSDRLLNDLTNPIRFRDRTTGRSVSYADAQISESFVNGLIEKKKNGEKWSGPTAHMSTNLELTDDVGNIFPSLHALYPGPILGLNDTDSASLGDFMMAILQSNNRAVVMGETSAGLGGPVYRENDAITGSQMSMRCTMGYCERKGGLPIENIGVVPDIYRPVTVLDVKDQFRSYATEVLDVAANLAAGAQVEQIQKVVSEGVRQRTAMQMKVGLGDLNPAIEAFNNSIETILSAELSEKEQIAQFTEAYKVVFEQLKASGERLTDDDWRALTIPLPPVLSENDAILKSLWRKGEVIERLKQMRELKRFEKQPEVIKLIDAIIEGSEQKAGEHRFADPCSLLLK